MQYKYILAILFLAVVTQAQGPPSSSSHASSVSAHTSSPAHTSTSHAISSHATSASGSASSLASSLKASASASPTQTSAGNSLTYNVLPEVMAMALLFIASFLVVLA